MLVVWFSWLEKHFYFPIECTYFRLHIHHARYNHWIIILILAMLSLNISTINTQVSPGICLSLSSIYEHICTCAEHQFQFVLKENSESVKSVKLFLQRKIFGGKKTHARYYIYPSMQILWNFKTSVFIHFPICSVEIHETIGWRGQVTYPGIFYYASTYKSTDPPVKRRTEWWIAPTA